MEVKGYGFHQSHLFAIYGEKQKHTIQQETSDVKKCEIQSITVGIF